MKINSYHVDAFTDKIFSGNPAAVCVMPEWLSEDKLHSIAKENNLPVTAFLVIKNETYHIRWITPEYELDLCGHGSLSAAYIIFNFINPDLKKVDLHSRTEILPVTYNQNLITLNFPTKNIEPCLLPLLEQGLGIKPKEIYQHKNERCFAVFNSEKEVAELKPNMQILKKLEHRGISVTAPGNGVDVGVDVGVGVNVDTDVGVDFVSRTFYPHKTISEDPATGASHCLLAPYWANKLNKNNLHAKQLSERGGEIFCEYKNDRVLISGKVVVYMQGVMQI